LQALFYSAHIYEKREGSGAGAGSGRPKNMRILQIRVLNTGKNMIFGLYSEKSGAFKLRQQKTTKKS
jgi:hypothetical protein